MDEKNAVVYTTEQVGGKTVKLPKLENKSKDYLITAKDLDDVFSCFKSDKERIKYMSVKYKNMSISEAFKKFYNVPEITETNPKQNIITKIELGQCYWGNVETISKDGIVFRIPGVKEEIVSKENFSDCMDSIKNYLLNKNNMLRFEVREKRHNTYYVSVLNAYYKLWLNSVERSIKKQEPIDVHVDSLTKGGYICHTTITPIKELTGKNYTSLVFIPGSNIVLNIERDFNRWLDTDVQIIPQKFAQFKQPGSPIENSLIGSRKLVLQQKGNQNLYDIYLKSQLLELNSKDSFNRMTFDGTVTGIINSNGKTGIFVELNDLYITGLMPIDSTELLDYKPGDQIKVAVNQFEVQEGKEPFVLKNNQVVYANTRCIFELA